jgi:lysozyme family protein
VKVNFPTAMSHVLASEGGFVDNPHDAGGATDEGVTQHQYDLWRTAKGLQTRSVRYIDQNEVEAIYRGSYWNAVNADALPAGVDYAVFDWSVLAGPHRAIEHLQQAAGVAADGSMGPVTLAAVNSADPRQLISAVCAERLAYLKTRPSWPYFHNGWSSRVASVEQAAEAMV